jgi:DNA-binding NarL/FixJ family response regulator
LPHLKQVLSFIFMKCILIIEDQAPMRRNLALMLEMEDYEVHTACNGSEGVEMARLVKPDLIICDVTMPVLDGHGVLHILRSQSTTSMIPFIFLTARGDKSDMRIGMNFGADDYLVKPVTREDLLAAVETRFARAGHLEARLQAMANSASRFQPDFTNHEPLIALGLTNREAEVLLWVAQGKSNGDIASILGSTEPTIKKHVSNMFEKLGVENRNAAAIQALETLTNGKIPP